MTDYNELYENDEDFRNFVESKKEGLINNRDNILKELHDSTSQIKELTEKSNALTEKVSRYENEITNNLINNAFNGVEGINLIDGADGIVKDKIYNQAPDGFNLKINGNNKIVLADKEGKTFTSYFKEYSKTDEAKNFIKNPSVGGGAMGSGNGSFVITKDTLSSTNPVELAKKLNDPNFRSQLESYLKNNSEV